MENENSYIDEIVEALLRLQALKIERVFDVSAEITLLCTSFDEMNEIRLKRDQEISAINTETEQELIKYKAKS